MDCQIQCSTGDTGRQKFEVHTEAVLLTYQGLAGSDQWERFLVFVCLHLKPWRVKYWCATLETCKSGTKHTHLMLQFTSKTRKFTSAFEFEDIHPNAAANDMLGEGLGGRNYQLSVDRAMFYVYVDKIGPGSGEPSSQWTYGI